MQQLGFAPTPALIEAFGTLNEGQLAALHRDLMKTLRRMVGADVVMAPMYPNFPQEVMEASEAELYINALLHYLGDALGYRIMPQVSAEPRLSLPKGLKLRPIDVASPDAAKVLARKLMSAPTSLSASDRSDLTALLNLFLPDGTVAELMPPSIPHKETLTHVAATLLADPEAADVLLTRYFKTATDVLRLAVSLCGGDVSLAKTTKFRALKRSTRRLLLSLLERCGGLREDMQRRPEVFKRLGERLHPGEYRKRFPKTASAFDAIRNGDRVATFASRVEAALASRDVATAVGLLKTRPGELARRIDQLLRLGSSSDDVVRAFDAVSERVATPVLLQLTAHLQSRGEERPFRTFFPKGDVARLTTVEGARPALERQPRLSIIASAKRALMKRFGERKPLGKVFIDPALQALTVPLAQRSASKSLRTLVRGSRLPLPDTNTLRFFLWWHEGKMANGKSTGRVDVDLSAVLYDAQWQMKTHITYTQLRDESINACHSGDITSAPNGACEFIDIDIQAATDAGIRYVIMSVFCFSAHTFVELPQCFAGWMGRDAPQSGEVFEPSTVVDRLDLAADKRIAVPAIVDLETRELLWCDLALSKRLSLYANVESNQRGLHQLGRAMVSASLPTMYDLLSLHVASRGRQVSTAKEADLVFGPDGDLTPFDVDTIIAEYL